ncbi:MAG: efflux transporter outer membrane subunit [Rhodocyclaceae bacterium]|nr:efflux transporter outer membrane subunit [Rhodocyclaceae bacterium]
MHRTAILNPVPATALWVALACALLGGCAVGPDYVRPQVAAPASFKEATTAAATDKWQTLDNAAAGVPATPEAWWKAFGDPALDALEQELQINNQNIALAEAQYRAARAALDSANAAFYPTVNGSFGATRAANAIVNNSNGTQSQGASSPNTTVNLSASASWELDVWGKIRRSSEAAGAKLDASAADVAAARLSAQALLAQTYIQLRSAELQLDLQKRTVVAYTRYLELTRNRYSVGVASPLDVSNAESQLATARATGHTVELQRAQYEHALATLVGKTPSELSIPGTAALPAQPATPALVPSTWLATRPDIVAAERRVAAANAQIGVAKAAWFPSLTLTGSAGYRNNELADLISLPHRFWSLGPALALALFDGGARSAAVASAGAAYDQSVATYRQTVLTAFQEVEDNLAAARLVGEERQEREVAANAARRTREIAENQYLAGTSGQLEVTVAQGTELSAERTLIDAQQRHLQAAVQLYKNTGRVSLTESGGQEKAQ